MYKIRSLFLWPSVSLYIDANLLSWKGNLLLILSISFCVCASASEADGKCSKSEIRELSDGGLTIQGIAKKCKMDIIDVKAALQEVSAQVPEDKSSPGGTSQPPKLQPGQPVSQCGCWGVAYLNQPFPTPICTSGFSLPVICPTLSCPTGGNMWFGICQP